MIIQFAKGDIDKVDNLQRLPVWKWLILLKYNHQEYLNKERQYEQMNNE